MDRTCPICKELVVSTNSNEGIEIAIKFRIVPFLHPIQKIADWICPKCGHFMDLIGESPSPSRSG